MSEDDATLRALEPARPPARGRVSVTRSAPPPPTPCCPTTSSWPTTPGTTTGLASRPPAMPPMSSSSPPPVTRSPTVSTDSTASAIFTPRGASSRPRTLTATSTCGRRSVGSSTASPHERRRGPRGRVIVCPNRQGRPLRCVRCGRPSAFGPVSGRDHQSVSCSPSSSWSRARSSATSCGSSPRQVAQLPRLPTRATRVGQRAVGQPRLYRPLPAILRRARHHDVVRRDPLA